MVSLSRGRLWSSRSSCVPPPRMSEVSTSCFRIRSWAAWSSATPCSASSRAKLQLIEIELLGMRAEPMPQQTLYQQPQLLVLGLQLGHHFPQHALQDIRFVRQCREVDRACADTDAGSRRSGSQNGGSRSSETPSPFSGRRGCLHLSFA
jgi:hypothetical protein